METVLIRKARSTDIAELCSLLYSLFEIEEDFSFDEKKQSSGLTLLLEDERAEIFVAQLSENIVGMCTIQEHISTSEGCRVGIVEDVVVSKSQRGKKIGSKLIEHVVEHATKKGYARIQLLADEANLPAHSFYRKRGWSKTQLTAWFQRID